MSAISASLLWGCPAAPAFECDTHDQCGGDNLCLGGRCALSDATCDSGYRFGRLAEPGVASTCAGVCEDDATCRSGQRCVGTVADTTLGACAAEDATCASGLRFEYAPGSSGACVDVATSCARQLASGRDFICAINGSDEIWCWATVADPAGPAITLNGITLTSTPTQVDRQPTEARGGRIDVGPNLLCREDAQRTHACWSAVIPDKRCSGNGTGGGMCAQGASGLGGPIKSASSRWAIGRQHVCGIGTTTTQEVICWGSNNVGQVTDGVPSSIEVTSFVPVDSIVAGDDFTCIRGGGSGTGIKCWGTIGGPAQRFDDSDADGDADRTFAASGSAVAAGSQHVCRLEMGRVSCFGRDAEFQSFGSDGTWSECADPACASSVTRIWAGGRNTCFGRPTDSSTTLDVYCVGDNAAGQLGANAGGENRAATPVKLTTVPDDAEVVIADGQICVLADRRVTCWGRSFRTQLGAPVIGVQDGC